MDTWERRQAPHGVQHLGIMRSGSASTGRAGPGPRRLYRLIENHFEEFATVYDERFARRWGYWRPVVARVVEKYLA